MSVIIGGKSYSDAYVNDPKNQETIRQAVVGGGNNIQTVDNKGTITNNTTGAKITPTSTGKVTSTGATYTNDKGTSVTPYSERNSVGTVAAGTIFDPNSSNFNSVIANSQGKINLANIGDYNSQGIFTGANSGTKNEADSQAYYDNVMNGGQNQAQQLQRAISQANERIQGSSSYTAPTYTTSQPTLTTKENQQMQSISVPQTYAESTVKPINDSSIQQSLIQQQSDANKAAAAAQLQGVRDSAISGYNQKIGGLEQIYQPLRNQQDFQGQKNIKATNEELANMGISNSGDMVTAQIANRVGNENSLNALNQQQQGEKTNYENQILNANNAYNSDLASSNAGIDAIRLQNLIAQSNTDRGFNYQVGRDTVGDNRYNQQYQDSRNDLTYDRNYQSGRDAVADNQNAWQQNNTMQQQAIAQANAIWQQQQQMQQQQIENTGYMPNGQQTLQGQQSAAQIAASNANTAGQLIQNTYAGQIAQGQIDANKASLVYQNLVNSGYSKEESLKLGGMLASYNGQNLQNNYQSLVNQGYGQEQALKIATMASQLTGQNLNNTAQSIQNQYMPSQLQSAINAQNRSNTGGGSSGSSAAAKADKANIANATWAEFNNQTYNNNGEDWLQKNASEIIKTVGNTEYLKMLKELKNLPVNATQAYNDARQQHVTDYNQQPQ